VSLHGKACAFPRKSEEDLPSWPIRIPPPSAETFGIRKQGARARIIEVIQARF